MSAGKKLTEISSKIYYKKECYAMTENDQEVEMTHRRIDLTVIGSEKTRMTYNRLPISLAI
jgi:hypothetical protein